jgi:ribonuclease P protein component
LYAVLTNNKRFYCLTKREIIRRPQDFSELFQTGRFLQGRFFDVTYVIGDRQQVGFTTSKRIRTAVPRNRIKRMLREAYRFEKQNFAQRVRVILIGRENILHVHLDELRKEMRKMAARINAQISS